MLLDWEETRPDHLEETHTTLSVLWQHCWEDPHGCDGQVSSYMHIWPHSAESLMEETELSIFYTTCALEASDQGNWNHQFSSYIAQMVFRLLVPVRGRSKLLKQVLHQHLWAEWKSLMPFLAKKIRGKCCFFFCINMACQPSTLLQFTLSVTHIHTESRNKCKNFW